MIRIIRESKKRAVERARQVDEETYGGAKSNVSRDAPQANTEGNKEGALDEPG